jgi:hypothetical protein
VPSNALTTLLQTAPDQAYGLRIQQIVPLCGDGILRDSSGCSLELRHFLQSAPTERLSAYAAECLSESFSASGAVLQDIINELGRRLEYRVEHGLYQGRVNRIGHDGFWQDDHGAIVVEVKTTDTYRINLDRLESYRNRLEAERRISGDSSVLIVVGRQDTGDLEAQVRGSRHAWSIRLISVEALVKLVQIKEKTEEPTKKKIHELLTPFEYTKLDRIIEVVFDAAEDASIASEELVSIIRTDEVSGETGPNEDEIGRTRERIVASAGRKFKAIVRKSGVLYWSADGELRVAIAVSSRYPERSWPYWYAYRPAQDAFIRDAKIGYYVLGCTDLNSAYAIPFNVIHSMLNRLRKTVKGARHYWHIDLKAGEYTKPLFRLVEPREDFDLSQYEFEI